MEDWRCFGVEDSNVWRYEYWILYASFWMQAFFLQSQPSVAVAIHEIGEYFWPIEIFWYHLIRNCSSWDVWCWLHLERTSVKLAALHSLDFYFCVQLFFRLIRMSWTACRDCLMITMSDWTSSSKNPTSSSTLKKPPRRTINGTGWWDSVFRLNQNGWPYFACGIVLPFAW